MPQLFFRLFGLSQRVSRIFYPENSDYVVNPPGSLIAITAIQEISDSDIVVLHGYPLTCSVSQTEYSSAVVGCRL